MANRKDPYKVVVEATVGEPGKGDIAIDDVVFDKHCSYYEGPYTTPTSPITSTLTSESSTQSTHTSHTTHTPHTTISTSTESSTTSYVVTPSNEDTDSERRTVIIVVVFASFMFATVVALVAFTFYKKKISV